MRARWTTLAVVAVLAGLVVLADRYASSDEVASSSSSPSDEAGSAQGADSTLAADGATEEDPLLMRARAELADGGLSEETRAALLASNDPAHARARRVLLAMDAPEGVESPPATAAPDPNAADLVVPTLATTNSAPAKPSSGASTSRPSGASETPTVTKPEPIAKVDSLPTLSRVALAKSSNGATLTLDAGSGVVVGVANQRSSGIIRLLVEARAAVSVLSSRPQVHGARVSMVRRVGRSVFVTLELDPGWSMKRIRKTKHGAKVELVGPS